MLSIKNAKYLQGFELEVTFSDGRIGRADLKELIHRDKRAVFAPLKEEAVFKNFTIEYTIRWGENIDLAPEFLYFVAFEKSEELQDQFRKWGYV